MTNPTTGMKASPSEAAGDSSGGDSSISGLGSDGLMLTKAEPMHWKVKAESCTDGQNGHTYQYLMLYIKLPTHFAWLRALSGVSMTVGLSHLFRNSRGASGLTQALLVLLHELHERHEALRDLEDLVRCTAPTPLKEGVQAACRCRMRI